MIVLVSILINANLFSSSSQMFKLFFGQFSGFLFLLDQELSLFLAVRKIKIFSLNYTDVMMDFVPGSDPGSLQT